MMNQSGRCLASGIARAAMRSLQYKIACRCAAVGVRFVKAAPRFTGTQRCSGCGGLQDMPLRKAVCECLGCGLVIDRDDNAALNLQHDGEAAEPVKRVVCRLSLAGGVKCATGCHHDGGQ